MDLVFLSTSRAPCNLAVTCLGPRYSIITTTDFAPCSKQFWKGICCSHCTTKTYIPPEAHPSSSSLHPGHNPDCNFSPLLCPHTLKTLLTLMGVQPSLSEPRSSGSPASPCSCTSCRQICYFHALGAFLTSPPFLYSHWLCKTCSTTVGAEKEAPFCRGWLLPLYFR